MKHACEIVYELAGESKKYGLQKGICRVTGKESQGIPFSKWVRPTFNDHDSLLPGNIMSNAALFTFDEKSEILKKLTGRKPLQRFRTYSHIICDGEWHILTKADKLKMVELVKRNPMIVSLNSTGQKHVYFKHKIGFWQLDDWHIQPDVELFSQIYELMQKLLMSGFNQAEVKSGQYDSGKIYYLGMDNWKRLEDQLLVYRDTLMFEFCAFMLTLSDDQKQKVKELYNHKKQENAKSKKRGR